MQVAKVVGNHDGSGCGVVKVDRCGVISEGFGIGNELWYSNISVV